MDEGHLDYLESGTNGNNRMKTIDLLRRSMLFIALAFFSLGAISQASIALTNGEYTVERTGSITGCADAAFGHKVNDLSLEEILKNMVSIYPNPANSQIIVSLNGKQISDIHIVSTKGKVLRFLEASSPEVLIDLDDFEMGVYFVVVNSEGEFFTSKLIVNHL